MEQEPVPKRVRSYVWEHFDLISPRKVKCLICAQELTYSSNTSSMLRHLRAKHPETTPNTAATDASAAAAGGAGVGAQQGRQAELDEALVNMIVLDAQPFKVVEDKGFRAFVQKLDPTYVLPSRQTLKSMVDKKYEEAKKKSINELEKAEAVSVTADMWTSITMEAYLGVTCHFINENMELASVLLGVGHFTQSHTAENLRDAMELQLQRWGLRHKVHCLITDNASNMILCAKLMAVRNLPCFAHSLNLVVKKALEQTPVLTDIRTRGRRIVTFFKSSVKAKEKLAEVQNHLQTPPHKLLQEVDTRWNSTYLMLKRLHEQREAVSAALASIPTDIPPLVSLDYDAISECLEVLAPFYLATTELSAERIVSGSKVIPIIRMVQHKLASKAAGLKNETAGLLCQNLQQILATRCNVETIRVLALSTLLDPRFKTLAFGSQSYAQEAVAKLTAECATTIRGESAEPSTSQSAAMSEPNPEAGAVDNLWELLDSRVGATQQIPNPTANATVEVQRYLSEPYLSRGEDPLAYWKTRATTYPLLFSLAKKYLHMPATSVPCERVFSKAGEVASRRRSRLKPRTLETILFLNKNL
ncbi:zinc finger BED domain-containing protein 4-like [Betta splendens]|uniref:Zinc finger BED domain-containing protein 4-like n=1 Tax=Betta splendens TaxID=158456 RepID=A0A8M1H8A6_BETSP|nr:zinc finger BED domain-containing protein 4-like [Betta splendens]